MAAQVAIYELHTNKRSRMIAAAMREGITRQGDTATITASHNYRRPEGQIAVFYGFDRKLRQIFDEYRGLGRTVVFVDLGYWGRRDGGALSGYHKVAVNSRHPTDYFMARRHDPSRFKRFGLQIAEYRSGTHILLAGMSAKSADSEGFKPTEWERRTVSRLRQHTDRPIIYRPKPSWTEAAPIEGTEFAPGLDDLPRLLNDCHAIVTHHSNVAIDALLAGVPAFSATGPASLIAPSDLSRIEMPPRPADRAAFAADLAWTQFNVAEMRSGVAWQHLKDEGLI